MSKNIILNSDSYKYGMHLMYPPNTTNVYSYIESRGGLYDSIVFFGLQAFIKEYLLKPITQENIDEAEEIILAHGEPFNREGWEHILNVHNGYLPVVIRAAPEGSIIPTKNVLLTIENTDEKCFWLTTFLETALLRAIWYPTTVATNSYENKKLILKGLKETGTPEDIDFRLNDFGSRGVSSLESSGIGGAAHLINFKGTDNVAALMFARKYYHADIAGYSVKAAEHSVITSWGKNHEVDAYRNMITQFGEPGAIVAVVSDSYDFHNACKLWGTVLKDDVVNSGATLVVRPDSGDPATIVTEGLKILDQYYGHIVNNKGYRVLNNVRIIQGDGIDHQSIRSIIYTVTMAGYSLDNVSFGQGGALLQQVNRDTQAFAMKCSAVKVDSEWRDVFKDPITDKDKKSKKGRVALMKNDEGYYSEVNTAENDALVTVFKNGKLLVDYTFEQIRENAKLG
jgi:nicotinamide phosphoribosyltransferase